MRVLVLCIALVAIGLLGCQQAAETPAEQAETQMEETMEEVAMVDPVCGMEVTEESEWTAEYEGQTFYFCSEQCRDAFVADPAMHLMEEAEEAVEEVVDS